MKKTLLASVAVAAVVGFTSLAVAQGAMDQKGAGKPAGAAEEKAAPSGGAAMHPQSAAPRPAQSAQGADKMAKPESKPDKAAEGPDNKMTKPNKSADDADKAAKPDKRMGEEQKNETNPQRGAQEENKAQPRGAQTESDKAGTNATASHASSDKAGANVKLSSDQRSKISAVIGRGGGARLGANVNFNISVGTRVPRDVHVEVLPEDIVAIVPEYRGFDYIVVGDQILIIDPESLEIVTIIES
jgi:outer membrane biosynthesis protein TonB